MQDIFSVFLVAVFLLFFIRTNSKELQSNDSISTCEVSKVKEIPLQTEVLLNVRTCSFQRKLTLDKIHRYR